MQDKSNTNSSGQEQSGRQQESNEKQKRKRTRKDSDAQREHKCECGKSYLSYPALYTHQKQKHGGNKNIISSNRNLDDQRPDSPSSEAQTQDIFVTLANALSNENPSTQVTTNDLYDLVMWEIQLHMMTQDFTLSSYYDELLKKPIPQEIKNPQQAFIRFIHEVKQKLSFDQMKIVFLFVYTFRQLLLEFPDATTKSLVEKSNQLICQQLVKVTNEISMLSERSYIVNLVKTPNFREEMIQIVFCFCNWLYRLQLTDDKLLLKQQ